MKESEFNTFLYAFADMVMDHSYTKLKHTNPRYRLQVEEQCKTSYEIEQFIREKLEGTPAEWKEKIQKYFQRRDDIVLIEAQEMYLQGYRDCVQLMRLLGLLKLSE